MAIPRAGTFETRPPALEKTAQAVGRPRHRGLAGSVRRRRTPRPSTTASGTEWPRTPFIHAMKEAMMDWNRVEGNWKQVKGSVKQQWGKLTDDDLTQINGSQEKL